MRDGLHTRFWSRPWMNSLSLDVSVGAACIAYAISCRWNLEIPAQQYVLLAAAVWIIFTFDHLVDGYKIPGEAHSHRHRIHQKYRILIGATWIAVCAGFCILILQPENIFLLRYGWVGIAWLGLYFIGYYTLKRMGKPFPLKEICIALGFALGCLLLPVAAQEETGWQVRWEAVACMAGYLILLALHNLLLLSYFERASPGSDRDYSVSWWLNPIRVKILGFIIASASIFTLVVMNESPALYGSFSGLAWMNIAYLGIMAFPGYFSRNEKYRWCMDGVFILPGMYIWGVEYFV